MLYITMISISNFYAVLHFNLIQPTGLDTWYFYPFGTFNQLIKNEFNPEYKFKRERGMPHVLFHFDQEPIYLPSDWHEYDTIAGVYWSQKICRILANSEYSDTKKIVCKDRFMLDWYFFYHGFAALDWFKDSAFFGEIAPISKVFCSYNHLVTKKRSYRMALTARFCDMNLIDYGDVSFHGTRQDCEQETGYEYTELSARDKNLIANNLLDSNRLPMILDQVEINGNLSAHFSWHDYSLWQKPLVHIVNDTVFYDRKLHLTEKVFKPIVALRPFILVAGTGNLAYLRSYGFKTFSPWIDESYDEESDPSRRLDLIAIEVSKLCAKPMVELMSIYDEMLPILTYNKEHFFGKFREIIVSELVDNFDSCIRTWNNGRIDGRGQDTHPDPEAVKRLLLR